MKSISQICLKARVCNVVQKHILLYWVKWSCYPESSQYIMYSEKGTKIIKPKLTNPCFLARIAQIGQML